VRGKKNGWENLLSYFSAGMVVIKKDIICGKGMWAEGYKVLIYIIFLTLLNTT
jgi:hypothetical protein